MNSLAKSALVLLLVGVALWFLFHQKIDDILKGQVALREINTWQDAVDTYYLKYHFYPESLGLLTDPNPTDQTPPFLPKEMLIDPWGQAYQYEIPRRVNPSWVYSFGPPGQEEPIYAERREPPK